MYKTEITFQRLKYKYGNNPLTAGLMAMWEAEERARMAIAEAAKAIAEVQSERMKEAANLQRLCEGGVTSGALQTPNG